MTRKSIVLTLILFSQFVFAQGTAGSLFLSVNPGAKSSGMGEANIGIANDSYATYYNPAGLTNLSNKEFSFMHTSYLPNLVDDMSYDFLTFGMPFREGSAIGGHFTYLNLGDQTSTDANNTNLGIFSSYMYALNLSYAQKINEQSSWGLNGKYFFQELAVTGDFDASSSNFAIDIGYFRHNAFDNPDLKIGLVLTNIGPGVSFGDGEEDPLPTKFGLGSSLLLFEGKGIAALDLNYEINDKSMITNLGFEYSVSDQIFLRAGLVSNSAGEVNYSSLGFGFNLETIGFDLSYLLADEFDPHSDMLKFSLSGSF
jgi:long-subunit fatty acid transport protein